MTDKNDLFPGDLVKAGQPKIGLTIASGCLGLNDEGTPTEAPGSIVEIMPDTVMLYLDRIPVWEKGIEMLGEDGYWDVVLAGDRKLYIPSVFKLEAL